MGRGLSNLQQCILKQACANWEREVGAWGQKDGWDRKDRTKPDITRKEILHTYYGWAHTWKCALEDLPSLTHAFAPEEIGRKRYNAAHTALSRALDRLVARRLLAVFEDKYYLTAEGWTQGQLLSVEISVAVPKTQPIDSTHRSVELREPTQKTQPKHFEEWQEVFESWKLPRPVPQPEPKTLKHVFEDGIASLYWWEKIEQRVGAITSQTWDRNAVPKQFWKHAWKAGWNEEDIIIALLMLPIRDEQGEVVGSYAERFLTSWPPPRHDIMAALGIPAETAV